ncbi:type I DNA topoisomerase [Candidatus Peregrinibacteria bacterium]|nr:type I DNA topoisomerase [Candidatus Peregrinibacteria bacterium]
MSKNLVIVESPAKGRTIKKFLGSDYTVLASMGHVRDLPKSELGFDPENNFEPKYEVSKDKKKTVTELKKQIDKDTVIYLATDEDREGEAIAWHLISALKIQKHPLKRIVFHEITKTAILDAIKNPRDVDANLVDAQQARRILDRAVGYELSPLLWKKVKFGLSAGRVQSVAVRIIVDREREIRAFDPEEFWKIKTSFLEDGTEATPSQAQEDKVEGQDEKHKDWLLSELSKVHGKAKKIPNEKEATAIKESAESGKFLLKDIQEKEGLRKPAAPFTTSTLQQEAARKLGFSVKQTMIVAQQLYEGNVDIPNYSGGLITYMRTDSVNLSVQALTQAKEVITKEFGKEYSLASPRKYATKAKGAQEAHEAIRPVDLSMKPSGIEKYLDSQQFRLYDLIWKRTLATQMQDAKVASTTYIIEAGKDKELEFQSKGQRIVFPGFMKAYTEGTDNPEDALSSKDVILPAIEKGQELNFNKVMAEQCFTKPPARYTEASLVKKMESEGIGRPSTYAPTISTILAREYVEKTEDKKLKPTSIGEIVSDFLVKHFSNIVDLKFTASIEEKFDDIAEGKQKWEEMMKDFYSPFHDLVGEKEESVSRSEVVQERVLGEDPKSKKPVSVRMGRFGPFAQIGTKDDEEKPKFASLPKGKNLEDITLEEALFLFNLPRVVGKLSDTEEMIVNIGRFGPYVQVGKEYFSLSKDDDPYTVTSERAEELVKEGREKKAKALINSFKDGEIEVRVGRFGPYIRAGKKNIKIPKEFKDTPEDLTEEECEKIVKEAPEKKPFKRKKKS